MGSSFSLRTAVFVLGSALACLAGCQRERNAGPEPVSSSPALPNKAAVAAEPEAAKAPPQPLPVLVERVRVPGDMPASVIRPLDTNPPRIVFLPGICSNALGYVQAFGEAARAHGGVVALDGDQPCGNSKDFHSFSWDAGRQHARIEAAFAAAGMSEIPAGGITIVGYSQGASIAEQLVQRWPERYTRVVLIGAPTAPGPQRFLHARAVVTMSCSLDVSGRMREAARKINSAGVPSTFVEMPGCRHGQVAEGERVFSEAFDFLDDHSRPAAAGSSPVPIVGML